MVKCQSPSKIALNANMHIYRQFDNREDTDLTNRAAILVHPSFCKSQLRTVDGVFSTNGTANGTGNL